MNDSTSKRRQRAIVIGGSFAGLMAARILSDYFEQVTLIEQDKINDQPEARKGQPQVRHVHGLLANGLDVLTRYFPDLPDGLREGGSIVTDVGTAIRGHVADGYRRQFESGLIFALQCNQGAACKPAPFLANSRLTWDCRDLAGNLE